MTGFTYPLGLIGGSGLPEFIFVWTVPAGSVTIPTNSTFSGITNYNGKIDYGDGTGFLPFVDYNDANFTHNYAAGGTYTVRIKGQFASLYVNNGVTKTYFDKVIQWGNVGIHSFDAMFYGCSNLTEVPLSLPVSDATLATQTFRDCTSLTGDFPTWENVPNLLNTQQLYFNCINLTGGLVDFSVNTSLASMDSTYSQSGLSGIIDISKFPTTVTNFEAIFYKCYSLTGSLPDLRLLPNLTNIRGCFFDCNGLTGNLITLNGLNLSGLGLYQTYYNCSGLTGSIPTDMFATCSGVTWASQCFYNCSGLTGAIPSNLFSTMTSLQRLSSTFQGCSNLTGGVPDFTNNINLIYMDSAFRDCISLNGTIPVNTFINCSKITTFVNTFLNCSNLTGGVPDFSGCPNVTRYDYTFQACSGLNGTIPVNTFSTATVCTIFINTFVNCSGLTGSPPDMSNCVSVTSFQNFLSGCSGLTGNSGTYWLYGNNNLVPPLYDSGTPNGNNCYFNCTGLTDYATIPAYWK